MQNLTELGKAAEKVLGLIDKDKSMPLDYVAKRLKAALDECPEDPAIKGVASVVYKRLHKNAFATITKDELYSLYNDFYGDPNNQFRDKLGDLLPQFSGQKHSDFLRNTRAEYYDDKKMNDVKPLEMDVPDEYKSLAGLFHENKNLSPIEQIAKAAEKIVPQLRKYDKEVAKVGKDLVEMSFKVAGYNTEARDVIGDESQIIYCVAIDSPYKKHFLFVPTFVKNSDVQWPEYFLADDKLCAIKHDDIVNYVTGRDNPGTDYSRLFAKSSVVDDSVVVPKPLKILVASLEESLVEIGTSHGREAVAAGKDVVRNELESFGCRVNEVKVGSEHGDEIIYSASVSSKDGNIRIDVPVEFNNGRAIIPTTFACGDEFKKLTAENIRSTIEKNAGENVVYEFSMDVANMNHGELRDTMIYSVANRSFDKADEVLNFVRSKYGNDKYKQFFSEYVSAMKAISKTAGLDKCKGCPYLESAGKYYACAYCTKLAMEASKVVKTAYGCMRYERAVSDGTYTNLGTNIKLGD